VSTLLQIAGFGCLIFAFTLLCRPCVRPSPAAYALAITLDAACIAFILSVIVLWPSWWLLLPLTLWAIALWVHVLRLRDARALVRVLEANRAPLWLPPDDDRPPPRRY